MSKFSIVVRSILLFALVILLVSIIWGVTHRTHTNPNDTFVNSIENIRPRGSVTAAAIFLSTVVVLGIIIVSVSLVFKL